MQNTMAFVKILLFVAFLIEESYGNENYEMNEEAEADMFNCLCVITCELGNIFELEKLYTRLHQDMQSDFLHWYGDCYDMKWTEPKEYFDMFYDTVCPTPIHKKRECVKEFLMSLENYVEENCRESYHARICKSIDEAVANVQKLVADYMMKGYCYNSADMADKAVKDPDRITGYKESEIKQMGKDAFGK